MVPEGDKSEFPLLMIPYDTMCLSSGYIGTPPFIMKTVPDTVLKGNGICGNQSRNGGIT